MAHLRKQIRDFVVAALIGLPTTGDRTYPTRVFPLAEENVPGLCVYTEAEEIQNDDEDQIARIQKRSVFVVIEAYAAIVAGLDDELDQIAAEVEAAMFADRFFGGLVAGVDLAGSQPEISGESSTPVGILTIIFRVEYLTKEGEPEAKA